MNFPYKHLASENATQCEPGLRRVTLDMLLARAASSAAHGLEKRITARSPKPQNLSELQQRIVFFAGVHMPAPTKRPKGSFSSLRDIAAGKDAVNRYDSANGMKSQVESLRGKNTNAGTA